MAGRDVEQHLCQLARDQVGLVALRYRDHHVAVLDARLEQHGGVPRRCRAHVRRSRRSRELRSLVPSMSTTVMSLASDARLSATDEPTGRRRGLRFSRRESVRKSTHSMPNPYRSQSSFSPGENAERFQLSVQVRALETAALGDCAQ